MKWITRDKIKVDRVACPWLIRNFVDPEAEFVFLPHQTEWGKMDNGTVFDVPNCELGHHGEDVSFNSILKKYNLTEPALLLLGEIVRAADSHPTNPHPAGEGLRWIAGGFGALGLSDHEILEREFIVWKCLVDFLSSAYVASLGFVSKAPEGRHTPKPFAICEAAWNMRQFLECGSFLPLSDLRTKWTKLN